MTALTPVTDRQPSNDFRARIARPVFVRTFADPGAGIADNAANHFAGLVADNGGEVLDIRAYHVRDTSGDYAVDDHYRVVTYKAPRQINPG